MNKLEQKAIRQINLNESIMSKLADFFLGSKFRARMREINNMKADPELTASLSSLYQNYKIIENELENMYAQHPGLRDRIKQHNKGK